MEPARSIDRASDPEIQRRLIKKKRIPPVYVTISLLILLGLLFFLGNKNFLSFYNINTIVKFGAILLVVALGQMSTILIGGIDLSVGGTISFVSVLFILLLKPLGYMAYPVCILVGLLIGYINGNILTRIKIPSFIATLGTGGILTSLTYFMSARPVNVPPALYGMLDVINGSLSKVSNVLTIGIIVLIFYYMFFRFTSTGRNIYYVGANIKMAWMSGIDVIRTRNIAFMLSGVSAAIVGVTISSIRFGGDPVVGNSYVLTSIAAVVVGGTALTGGTGGVISTMFGALLITMLDNGMNVVGINQYFQMVILGAMIIVSVALTFDREKTPIIK